MKRIGVTGSIGMGKSQTALFFADYGLPLYDADAAVHALYRKGGAAAKAVGGAFPDAVRQGAVDRQRLSKLVKDSDKMALLEAIVHPLLMEGRRRFLEEARAASAGAVCLDIPLLFETGGERHVDRVVVASAPFAVQKARVMAREGMTEAKFSAMLKRQMPDEEKRARADYVVRTDKGLDHARLAVRAILEKEGLL